MPETAEKPEAPEALGYFVGLFDSKRAIVVTTLTGLVVGAGLVLFAQSRLDAHTLATVKPEIEAHAAAEEVKLTALAAAEDVKISAVRTTTDDHEKRLLEVEKARTADLKEIRASLDVMSSSVNTLKDSVLVLTVHDNDRVKRGR